MAEETSLPKFLQLDDKVVKAALNKLKNHGILESQEFNKKLFDSKIALELFGSENVQRYIGDDTHQEGRSESSAGNNQHREPTA